MARLSAHAIFEVLAYAVGFRLYLWQRRRFGDAIGSETRWSIVAAAILGANRHVEPRASPGQRRFQQSATRHISQFVAGLPNLQPAAVVAAADGADGPILAIDRPERQRHQHVAALQRQSLSTAAREDRRRPRIVPLQPLRSRPRAGRPPLWKTSSRARQSRIPPPRWHLSPPAV